MSAGYIDLLAQLLLLPQPPPPMPLVLQPLPRLSVCLLPFFCCRFLLPGSASRSVVTCSSVPRIGTTSSAAAGREHTGQAMPPPGSRSSFSARSLSTWPQGTRAEKGATRQETCVTGQRCGASPSPLLPSALLGSRWTLKTSLCKEPGSVWCGRRAGKHKICHRSRASAGVHNAACVLQAEQSRGLAGLPPGSTQQYNAPQAGQVPQRLAQLSQAVEVAVQRAALAARSAARRSLEVAPARKQELQHCRSVE